MPRSLEYFLSFCQKSDIFITFDPAPTHAGPVSGEFVPPKTIKYMKQRVQFGKPLSAFQGLQWMLAEMETKVNAARYLVYNAAYAKEHQKVFSKEAAMAKLYASQVAMDVTTKAVQIHGGYGYTREYPIERMMRDAKITEIYEGTSEVQKMVISGSLLKQWEDSLIWKKRLKEF